MTKKAITADDGTRFWLDLTAVPSVVKDLAMFPRALIRGCERCATLCITRDNLCSCCRAWSKTSPYPDDGKLHRGILRHGKMITAAEFADRLRGLT